MSQVSSLPQAQGLLQQFLKKHMTSTITYTSHVVFCGNSYSYSFYIKTACIAIIIRLYI